MMFLDGAVFGMVAMGVTRCHLMKPFHVMGIFHVRINEFPSLRDAFIFMFVGGGCMLEPFPDPGRNVVREQFHQFICRIGRQCLVGCGNGRFDGAGWLEPGIWRPFACPVDLDERLEKFPLRCRLLGFERLLK